MRLDLIIPEERKQREEVHSEIREGELSLFFMSHQDILASDLISQRLRAVIYSPAFEWTSAENKKGDETNLVHKNLGHGGKLEIIASNHQKFRHICLFSTTLVSSDPRTE